MYVLLIILRRSFEEIQNDPTKIALILAGSFDS